MKIELGRVTGTVSDQGIARVLSLLLIAGWLAVAPPVHAEEVIDAALALAQESQGNLTIIDVRTVGEWTQSGVPGGAAEISLLFAPGKFNERFVDDVLALVGADRDTPIATICARGNRSVMARDLLTKAGFTNVTSISEGMLGSSWGPGWLDRGLPLDRCKSC